MSVRRPVVVLLAAVAVVVLTACGGGGSDSDAAARPSRTATSPTPAMTPSQPATYTARQLREALPAQDDVADVVKVESVCPDDGVDACPTTAGIAEASTMLRLAAARVGSAAETEGRAGAALLDDVDLVVARSFDGESAAAGSVAASRKDSELFQGSYDFSDEPTTLGLLEKGTGSLTDLTIDGWTGFVSARTSKATHDGDTQTIQNAYAVLASGRTTVAVNVTVDVTGRADDFAEKLARTTLEGYLERLA